MAKRAELTGKRFGKLVVEEFVGIKNHGTLWKCRCDCGGYTIALAEKLNNGRKISCGCDTRERHSRGRIKDLTGKRFGRLVVLGLDHSKRRSYWKCRCDCGNEIVACADVLSGGLRRSCGCLKIHDLTGQKFGKLTVKSFSEVKDQVAIWECVCECGNAVKVQGGSLVTGGTRSCGCLKKENSAKTHELSHTRIYNIWKNMVRRCFCEDSGEYKNYGGRGITVCNAWIGEEGVKNFYDWSMENGYKEELTIDRIDVNGNYEPSNCRWADWETQNYNKRTTRRFSICGETKNLKEISEEYGIPLDKLRRKYYGVYVEEITIEELRELKK